MATISLRSGNAARLRVRGALGWTAGMMRYGIDRVLVLGADTLPYGVAIGMANAAGMVDTLATKGGRAAQAEARLCFGKSRMGAIRLASQWTSITYRDLVEVRRASKGREDLSLWEIEEVNADAAHELLASGRSAVVATGHFAAGTSLGLVKLFPEVSASAAVDPIEPFQWRGDVLRRRLAMGMRHELASQLRKGETEKVYVGQQDVQTALLARLAGGGTTGAAIAIDIVWERPGALRLPFAGYLDRPFAKGAARIARLAQVPVGVLVAERTGRRSVRLHFGDMIQPPAIDDKESDKVVTATLVHDLERQIGRFRGQYPHPIGWQRRWDAQSEEWVPF